MAGGFANVGYMGPGLTLAALGPEAAVPVALIFCFDALLVFTLVPLLMAFGGSTRRASAGPCATSPRASSSTRC